jgi:hypothetical protein
VRDIRVDVHQHVWPAPFLDALRRRAQPPRLDGWTLLLDGEPPYAVDPADHDVDRRAALAREDGDDLVLVAPSAALGLAGLPPDDAGALAEAWQAGARELPAPFRPWAMAGVREPDPAALAAALDDGCVGVELPAAVLADPAALERVAPLLDVVRARDAAVLVHPGPAAVPSGAPPWWAPVVDYVAQLHAAWWAWAHHGRELAGPVRMLFVALAGLAPLHRERHRARGGEPQAVDPLVFLETSSYGTLAIDATVRVLGVDVVCAGSDRPYATRTDPALGPAVDHALRVANPGRLLTATSQEESLR